MTIYHYQHPLLQRSLSPKGNNEKDSIRRIILVTTLKEYLYVLIALA